MYKRQQQGSANDIAVDTDTGNFYVTGACDITLFDMDGVESDAYIRSFTSFSDDSTTLEFETGGLPEVMSMTGHSLARYGGELYLVGTQTDQKGIGNIYVYSSELGITQVFANPANESGNGIAVNSSGIYVTGTTNGLFGEFCDGVEECTIAPDITHLDVVVIKLDFNLEIVWAKQFNSTAFPKGDGCLNEIGCSVAVNQDNDVYVAGAAGGQGLLLRYDEDGNRIWERRLGGADTPVAELSANYVSFADVATDLVSGVYVIGNTSGQIDPSVQAGTTGRSLFFARYNDIQDIGQFEWAKQIENEDFTSSAGYSIAVDSRNNPAQHAEIYVAGNVEFPSDSPPPTPTKNGTTSSPATICGFIDEGTFINNISSGVQLLAGRYSQTGASFLLGDVDCNGVVNLLDIQPFVDLITTGTFSLKADFNEDGTVDLLDLLPFIDLINGG